MSLLENPLLMLPNTIKDILLSGISVPILAIKGNYNLKKPQI